MTNELPESAQDSCQVVLTDPGRRKIGVIKIIRAKTGLDLKTTKDLVDGAPSVIGVFDMKDAETLAAEVAGAGGQVELRQSDALVPGPVFGSVEERLVAWVSSSLHPDERSEAIVQLANFWGRGSHRYAVFTSQRMLIVHDGKPPEHPDWIPYRGVTGFSGEWSWPFSTSIELDIFGRTNELKLDFKDEDDHRRVLQLLRNYTFQT